MEFCSIATQYDTTAVDGLEGGRAARGRGRIVKPRKKRLLTFLESTRWKKKGLGVRGSGILEIISLDNCEDCIFFSLCVLSIME